VRFVLLGDHVGRELAVILMVVVLVGWKFGWLRAGVGGFGGGRQELL
jgi:hypothetical protein